MMNDWEPFVFAVQSVKGERDCEKISTFKGPKLEVRFVRTVQLSRAAQVPILIVFSC
jgi:hypothetical protein